MTSREVAIARALDAEVLRASVTSHRHVSVDELLAGLEAEGWTVARRRRRESSLAVAVIAALVALLWLVAVTLDQLAR